LQFVEGYVRNILTMSQFNEAYGSCF
jgi:hypothetical protein